MNVDKYSHMDIRLHNDELQAMGQIIRLAHERLEGAPAQQMRGIPLERQAGLCGPDLFRVREMIEKLAEATGVELQVPVPEYKVAVCTMIKV